MITAAKRASLPTSVFGIPGSRKYPTDTKKRARAALSYASKNYHRGNISASQLKAIQAKAHARLGH